MSRTRNRYLPLLPVLLVGMLAGCDDGGKAPVQLFFGMHNWNDCEAAGFEINLEGAQAELRRTLLGNPDCHSAFDEACDVTITEEDGGMRLRVEIRNCFIDAYSSLAGCWFESADIPRLEANTFATCDCESETRCYLNRDHCDVSPYLCISPSADPGSCEDCFNEIDDDGNGIVDCEDPNCSPSFECETLGSSTTATCPNSTMPTTTSLPTTSLPAPASD